MDTEDKLVCSEVMEPLGFKGMVCWVADLACWDLEMGTEGKLVCSEVMEPLGFKEMACWAADLACWDLDLDMVNLSPLE